MAKKSKRNIKALLAKRQQLEALERGKTVSIPGSSLTPALVRPALSPPSPESTQSLPAYTPGKEIWRTVISTVIVVAVLLAIIALNHTHPILDRYGDHLYKTLNLTK